MLYLHSAVGDTLADVVPKRDGVHPVFAVTAIGRRRSAAVAVTHGYRPHQKEHQVQAQLFKPITIRK